jgi:Na+-driven multidrug efflux pump
LGFPGVFMGILDFGAFELLSLFAGLIGVVELSAVALVVSFGNVLYASAYGMMITVTALSSSALGQWKIKKAKEYTSLALQFMFYLSFSVAVLILIFRTNISPLFTGEPQI